MSGYFESHLLLFYADAHLLQFEAESLPCCQIWGVHFVWGL